MYLFRCDEHIRTLLFIIIRAGIIFEMFLLHDENQKINLKNLSTLISKKTKINKNGDKHSEIINDSISVKFTLNNKSWILIEAPFKMHKINRCLIE